MQNAGAEAFTGLVSFPKKQKKQSTSTWNVGCGSGLG